MRVDADVKLITGTKEQIRDRLAELTAQREALLKTSKEEDPSSP